MSKFLEGLNPSQREAVTHTIGPLLIIAGPGSGKTRTVVHSIAYAIENGVMPEQILAFSFTVKASKELRDRVKENVGEEKGSLVNISTFHSFCRQVLREDIDKLGRGYARNFRTLEENNQRNIIRNLARINEQRVRAEIEHTQFFDFPNPEEVLNFIKKCKAREISPSDAGPHADEFHRSEDYIKIYESYERYLKTKGWIDYESQQLFTEELFRNVPEVKTKWQNRFALIFVDEYQDTDPIQYRIVKALAESHQNLRVVGDDDQGIYGWRGADIQNILNFEKNYPNAKVISLGQNYRSTQKIVEISHALAEFNPDRRDKDLFTRNFEGEKVKYLHCDNDEEEAATIASFIQRSIDQGNWRPSDFAVLYRTNKQAYALKTALRDLDISIMTIHKSKGLEFPNVFVTGICRDLLPHYHNSDEKDWGEELRLLYVAMTRAKNWLCLSSYEEEGKFQRKRGRSPFLERGYIPFRLLESVETLESVMIPPSPPEMTVPVTTGETAEYIEPLPEKLLGDGMTVLGIDPGIQNVGWSITKKSPVGYTVLRSGTQTTTGWQNTLVQTERTINKLITLYHPDAIAVEKLEGATEEWFRYVAGCVATIRNIADQHRIECQLYTPQHVKYIATNNRNASKPDVQKGVMRICNLQQIPEPHHSADAIATSLCYLRNYLNSSRFEGNKRKQEHYEMGCGYLDKKRYETAIDTFKETINIDPVYTQAYYGLGRAYLAQNDLDGTEIAATTALRFAENNHPDSQKLLDAIERYHSGCTFLKKSEWNIAIDKFQESINLEPIFTEAHCRLSRAYFEVGNLEAARDAAEETLRLKDEYPSAQKLLVDIKMKYYHKGRTSFNSGEYDQAIFEFQKAVEIDRDFKGAHVCLGETYLKVEDIETAEKEAREALRVDATYELASVLLRKIKQKHKEHGDDYRKEKMFTQALKSYQHAIRIDNKYKEAYHNLGILYRRMKRYDKAIEAYQQAIDIDERSHVTYSDFSFVYREIGETEKAVDLLKRAIATKPDYQRAYYNLAETYFEMKNLQAASETLLESLRLDADDPDTLKLLKNIQSVYLKQGRNYFRKNNLEAAEFSVKAALRLGSDYRRVHRLWNDIKSGYYKQGLACIENGMYDAAISVLQKAVRMDPRFKEAHYSLSETYFKMGDFETAEEKVKQTLWIDPNYEPASCLLISIKEEYYKRGLTSLEQNEWKAAEKFAKEILRIDPNYEPAYRLLKQACYELGLAHLQKGAHSKAISPLRKAKDIDPNCERTHYSLGFAYFKLDRLEEAKLEIKEALSIQPNYPKARELLSEINDPRNWLKLGRAKVHRWARRIINRIGFS